MRLLIGSLSAVFLLFFCLDLSSVLSNLLKHDWSMQTDGVTSADGMIGHVRSTSQGMEYQVEAR